MKQKTQLYKENLPNGKPGEKTWLVTEYTYAASSRSEDKLRNKLNQLFTADYFASAPTITMVEQLVYQQIKALIPERDKDKFKVVISKAGQIVAAPNTTYFRLVVWYKKRAFYMLIEPLKRLNEKKVKTKFEVIHDQQVKINVGEMEYTIDEHQGHIRVRKFDTNGGSDAISVKPEVSNIIRIQ